MVYLHMHYIRNWMISLLTYAIIYTEIMVLLFYNYGRRFVNEDLAGAIIDITYYIVVFAWFVGCSVFAIRTHEMMEREGFYSKHQQEEETKEWQRLLNDLPSPVIITHRSDIRFFNKATLELLDIPHTHTDLFETQREQLCGQLEQLKQKETKESLKNIIESFNKTGPVLSSNETLFVYKKDGNSESKRMVTIKCVQSEDKENTVVEYIFHDITALKDLEQNEAREQCFDILLATASHDIRTPLNVMLGVFDVLADQVTTPQGKEQISVARSCGQRMLLYLEGLTFIRQINLGSLTVTKRLFSPVDATRTILRTMEFSAQAKSLRLNLSVDGAVPSVICSDRAMYSIILQNLMENAIKYTYSGGISVYLKYNEQKQQLITDVVDTGIGMTLEQQQNIGNLFQKQKFRHCLNPQGLGLGVFLAKTMSHQLNGFFNLQSVQEHGTTAEFAIECSRLEEACSERAAAGDASGGAMSTALPISFDCPCTKVLLVDDEPFNLMVLSAYLASVGIKADKAENGKIALEHIENKADTGECCSGYSVIFMDINMPVMDGIETTARIVQMMREERIPECHIVAVTAAVGLDNPTIYEGYVAKGFTELCTPCI